MFRNYIMISYRRHKYFCPISVYIFTKRRCEYFLTKPFQFVFNHLLRGSNFANSILIHNWNISCDKYQVLKWINLYFVSKRRTGRRRNIGTSHFVLCETKPNNLSILCMKKFLFVYFVYEKNPCCVWHILTTLFLSILCMTLSLISTFSIYYIINFIFFSKNNFSPNWCVWSCWSSHTSCRR